MDFPNCNIQVLDEENLDIPFLELFDNLRAINAGIRIPTIGLVAIRIPPSCHLAGRVVFGECGAAHNQTRDKSQENDCLPHYIVLPEDYLTLF